MTSVLIVDDHASMRESLGGALLETGEFTVQGELSTAATAQAWCLRYSPGLVLMDIHTENGASGLEAAKEIRRTCPQIRIIIMTGHDELSYLPRAKEIGADAFLHKSQSLNSFVDAARRVMAGEKVFPEAKPARLPHGEVPLNEREMEILRLMCRSMTAREIADALFISESTVKYHKQNMLNKTGFSRTVDLCFYMVTNGWINPLY